MKKKQAIAVIFSNVNLYDFLWYYATYGRDYEWTAVTEYYVDSDIELSAECRRIGIFKDVRFYDVNTKHMSVLRKAMEFAKMIAYYVIGKRDTYCKKLIAGCVDDYDLAVVSNSIELLHGAFISQSLEKPVVILEDGGNDRRDTSHKWVRSNGGIDIIYNMVDYLCSRMGYCDLGNRYELDSCRNCIKYSLHPEQIRHRTYKQVFKIHDNTYTDIELLKRLIRNWCGDILPEQSHADAILYTMPMEGVFENEKELKCRVEMYINENYKGKSILLKKHPRDLYEYVFDEMVNVTEIPSSIPAEVFVDGIETDICLFEYISSVLDSYREMKDKVRLFFFSDSKFVAYYGNYKTMMEQFCKIHGLDADNIETL